MNHRMRGGKSSELIVSGQLIRYGLDVYIPCFDDQAIDLVVRVEHESEVWFYDLQVKSVVGRNRIIGVKSPDTQKGNYILILDYRLSDGSDEFFYLTREQIAQHHLAGSSWGDLVFNRQEREQYATQNLADLARLLKEGGVEPTAH